MSGETDFEPRPVSERRTVLGEGNLLRVSTVVALIAVIAGGFLSFQNLRDEIRERADANAAATAKSMSELQGAIADTARAVTELRYDITMRTANVVPRTAVELWIERLARKNPTVDVPPFP